MKQNKKQSLNTLNTCHFQYRYKSAQSRIRSDNQIDQLNTDYSQLYDQDISQVLKLIQQCKFVILSHSSSIKIQKKTILSLFDKVDMKGIDVLTNIQDMKIYINKSESQRKMNVFLSVFGQELLKTKPYLIKFVSLLQQQRNKEMKLIVYCQRSQYNKIEQIVNKIQQCPKYQLAELDVPMPFETSVTPALLEILQNFLSDQLKKPTKKDIIIFHEPTQSFKKQLFKMTRTKGYHVSSQIIYDNEQINNYDSTINRIFVSQNTKNLLKNGYDLSQAYLVLDYQDDVYHYFDYQKCCYVQARGRFSFEQKMRRVNIIGGNMCEYVCNQKYGNGDYIEQKQETKYQDYGSYCLAMLSLGLTLELQKQLKQIPQLKYCYETLKNSGVINNQGKISSQKILEFSYEGINPIFAKTIIRQIQQNQQPRKIHLLLLVQAILTSPNLRNQQQQVNPAAVWHKTGYIQSCLDIVTKCKQMESQLSNSDYFDDIIYNLQLQINSYKYLIKEYERLCKLFSMQQIKFDKQLDEEQFSHILEVLITMFKPAVCTFSGSRRLGYLFRGSNQGCLAHKKCLMSYFNQKPNFIIITKMLIDQQSQNKKIINCNYVSDEIIVMAHGCLPTLSKQSYGECQIQFHNISTAVFNHLSKYNGLQMDIFQNQYDCSIQANSQLNAITIQCKKQKQKEINEKFGQVLEDIHQMYKKATKSYKQSQYLRVILSTGAQVSQLLINEGSKSNQVLDMAIVKNLSPQVGIQELKQLFDEFVQLKDIKVQHNQTQKTNQAIVSFYSHDDYKKFFAYFSGCNYYDYCMIVYPFYDETKNYTSEKYLLFEWNVWKSTGQALIEFKTPEEAKNSLTNLRNLAGERSKFQLKGPIIFAEGLDLKVDQKDLASWLSGQGTLVNLQVRRFCPRNYQQEPVLIQRIIKKAFSGQTIQLNVDKIIKGKNGHRSCKVKIHDNNFMNQIYFVLNEAEGIVERGKLYVSPVFTYPIKLPETNDAYEAIYIDIIKQMSTQLGRLQCLETELIKDPLQYTLIVKSNSEDEMQIIKSLLMQKLKGQSLNLKIDDTSILFTQLALQNLYQLQKKLPVKIIPDFLEKKIKVLCRSSLFSVIEKQINTKISESFVYQIPLYQKAYIYLQKNIEEITSEQIKLGLKYKFEPLLKNVCLEGNMMMLQKARDKITKSLKKLKQNIQDNSQQSNICKLCCEQLKHPFKLQGCGHAFCFDCIQGSIKYTLNDINLYPIKCPDCMQKIWICDLNCLIQEKQWKQILKISINHFVYTRPGEFMFCFTAGCTFISNIQFKSSYTCKQCKKGYCLSCKNFSHPGMTCHEARYGSDRLFSEYMAGVGGRVCANKSCKAPIERISGCFKVQCSRCKKCMCFKCPPGSMIPYETPQETYNHMNRAHGGCF